MKKTFRFLSMAALALMGAVMTGCSSDDNIDNAQPENKSKVVTLTAKVGFEASAGTRALDASGHKTFATGDKMAVIYKNTSGEFKRADGTLSSGAGTQSATFDITLSDPDNTAPIRYIYPAAMAKEESELGATITIADDASTVDFTKLNTQDGTLAKLGSDLDLCILDTPAGWSTTELPSGTLSNKLAILAINLKNGSDITSSITGLTISDGTNNYAVSGISSASTIYVAIRPTSDASLSVIATAGTNYYGKYLTSKTYAANNGYNVTWNMTPLTKVTWDNTNVFVEANQKDELSSEPRASSSLTYESITISGVFSNDSYSYFVPYAIGTGDTFLNVTADESCTESFTFTASGSKNFYKIEITGFPVNLNDANWSLQGPLLVEGSSFIWSKAPSNTVTITASPAYSSTDFDHVTSMVFLTD